MFICCIYTYCHVYFPAILARCYEDVRNVLLMRNQRIMMNHQGIDMQSPSQQGAMAMAQAAVQAASQMGSHTGHMG